MVYGLRDAPSGRELGGYERTVAAQPVVDIVELVGHHRIAEGANVEDSHARPSISLRTQTATRHLFAASHRQQATLGKRALPWSRKSKCMRAVGEGKELSRRFCAWLDGKLSRIDPSA